MTKRFSLIYATFGPLVHASASVWHRRLVVRHAERFPEGPVLLISNHQNGMEDPLMCCTQSPRQLHFLTRADIFKHPFADFLLRAMNMIPVYRPRDRRADSRDRNKISFLKARERLSKGCAIALFPEGNHRNRHHLRPFKSGLARIGLEALDSWVGQSDMPKEIHILPVGLDYENFTAFRSELLVHFGEPFGIADKLVTYRENPQQAIGEIMRQAREHLSACMVNIESTERHDVIASLRPIDRQRRNPQKARKANLEDDLLAFQKTAADLQEISDEAFSEVGDLSTRYETASEKAGLRPHEVNGNDLRGSSRFMRTLWLILGAPLFAAGAVLNFPPALLTRWIVRNKVPDPHFKSSFGIAVPALAMPIWWVLLMAFVSVVWSYLLAPFTLIAAMSLGIIAVKYRDSALVLFRANRYRKLLASGNKDFQSAQTALKGLYTKLDNVGQSQPSHVQTH